MKSILAILVCCIALESGGQQKLLISTADFKSAAGYWKGSLTYLDYGSGKPFSMPANVMLSLEKTKLVVLSNEYPNEPKANNRDSLIISDDGTMLDGAKVVSREILEDGAVKIITQKTGNDGNDHRAALLKYIYILGKNSFQQRKEVKFVGTDQWIMRHEFLYSR
ncbi:MAG: hypothetical protein RLZZ28_1698 [Bacteroidota bacterium]|jgi:hypothetical protein